MSGTQKTTLLASALKRFAPSFAGGAGASNAGVETRQNESSVPMEQRSGTMSISDGAAWAQYFNSILGLDGSKRISAVQAYGIVTFFACIKRLSEDLATLPIHVVRKDNGADGLKYTVVEKHPAYTLLNRIPNEYESSAEMRERAIADSLLRGHGYIHTVRNAGYQPVSMQYIPRVLVTYFMDRFDKVVLYSISGISNQIPVEDVIRISSFCGTDPVIQFNGLLGLALNAEQYAKLYFGKGGAVEGYLSHPNGLKTEQKNSVREGWQEAGKTGQTRILEYGMEYKVVNGRPVDSEMNATRENNDKQICRIFSMPPQLVGIDTTSRYDSVEALSSFYIQNVLRPWCVKMEQELDRKLLMLSERANHFFQFDIDAIRATLSDVRWKNYDTALKLGVYSINEVRQMEQMNKIPGGDAHLVQLNQITLDKMDEYSSKVTAEGPATGPAASNTNK